MRCTSATIVRSPRGFEVSPRNTSSGGEHITSTAPSRRKRLPWVSPFDASAADRKQGLRPVLYGKPSTQASNPRSVRPPSTAATMRLSSHLPRHHATHHRHDEPTTRHLTPCRHRRCCRPVATALGSSAFRGPCCSKASCHHSIRRPSPRTRRAGPICIWPATLARQQLPGHLARPPTHSPPEQNHVRETAPAPVLLHCRTAPPPQEQGATTKKKGKSRPAPYLWRWALPPAAELSLGCRSRP